MNYEDYQLALEEADRRMKSKNGHQFMTILKTRCMHCGASPKVKTKCRGWFQTFTDLLGVVLQERGVITTPTHKSPHPDTQPQSKQTEPPPPVP